MANEKPKLNKVFIHNHVKELQDHLNTAWQLCQTDDGNKLLLESYLKKLNAETEEILETLKQGEQS